MTIPAPWCGPSSGRHEKRGSREWKKREVDKFVYFWAPPQRAPFLAKSVGEDVARPLPLPMMGIQGP